jgi:hypothetical protein
MKRKAMDLRTVVNNGIDEALRSLTSPELAKILGDSETLQWTEARSLYETRMLLECVRRLEKME